MIPVGDIVASVLRAIAEFIGWKRLEKQEQVEGRARRKEEQTARTKHERTIDRIDAAVGRGDSHGVNELVDELLDEPDTRDPRR